MKIKNQKKKKKTRKKQQQQWKAQKTTKNNNKKNRIKYSVQALYLCALKCETNSNKKPQKDEKQKKQTKKATEKNKKNETWMQWYCKLPLVTGQDQEDATVALSGPWMMSTTFPPRNI